MKRRSGENSRRKFIGKCLTGSCAALAGMIVLAGCDQKKSIEEKSSGGTTPDHCGDLSNITESDIALRKKLGYVKETPMPDNRCENCNLYLPPKQGEKCGGCMLFKGPVYSDAYCTYWAPKI